MTGAALYLTKPYGNGQKSRHKDSVGFWLFVLMLCLLPIERFVFPFSLRVADGVLMLLVMYGLVKMWRTRQRLEFPLLLPIWLILLASLVATLMGFAHFDSVIAIVQEVYLFIWFIVLVNILKELPLLDLDRLMKIWSMIACVEATTTLMGMLRIGPYIFYTSFFVHSPGQARVISTGGFSRAVGTFVNPNAAAAYLSISFFVLMATRWPVWLRLALGVWLLAGMFGTGSMGALLSTIISLIVLVVMYSIVKNRRALLLWSALLGLAASTIAMLLLIFNLWPALSPRLGIDTNMRLLALTLGRLPHSVGGRLTRIENVWPIYSLHPWGTGPNSFEFLELSLHNDYLAFLFERGPIGLIGWVGIVGSALLTALRAACQSVDRYHRWCMLALGAGFLALAVNSFTHEVSHFRQLWVLMAFLFAISYVDLARTKTNACGIVASSRGGNPNDAR